MLVRCLHEPGNHLQDVGVAYVRIGKPWRIDKSYLLALERDLVLVHGVGLCRRRETVSGAQCNVFMSNSRDLNPFPMPTSLPANLEMKLLLPDPVMPQTAMSTG
jgi:hypothetical protein